MGSRPKLRTTAAVAIVAAVASVVAVSTPWASAHRDGSGYEPTLDPSDFSTSITNRYFPLPVGRVLTYTGVKDGESVRETVTVTSDTKVVAEGITARVVHDELTTAAGVLREKT